jgi:glutathione S-transferase
VIFYDSPNPAPNPRRVRIFAAEKGITLPTQTISIMAREQKSPEYLEALHPDPPLFGSTPVEIAIIDMWIRRVELVLMPPIGAIWVNCHPFTAKVVPERFPEYGESNRPKVITAIGMCNDALAKTPFIAGDAFSAADIILLTTIDFADFIGMPMPDAMTHLRDWYARVSARPSATA